MFLSIRTCSKLYKNIEYLLKVGKVGTNVAGTFKYTHTNIKFWSQCLI